MSTFYVSTAGNDSTGTGSLANPWRTVAHGLSAPHSSSGLAPGDTLYLRGGTYAEQVLSIPGGGGTSWSAPVIIASYPSETAVLQAGSGHSRGVKLSAGEKYVVFGNLVFDGTGLTYVFQSTVVFDINNDTSAAHHIRIQGGEVRNSPAQGVETSGGCDSNEFLGVRVHHNGQATGEHGFYVTSSNNLIQGCEIDHNYDYGVQIYSGTPGVSPSGNTVTACRIHDQTHGGGVVVGTTNVSPLATGNAVLNCLLWANPIHLQTYGNDSGTLFYNNTCYSATSTSTSGIGAVDIGNSAGSTSAQVIDCIIGAVTGGTVQGVWIHSASTGTLLSHDLLYNCPSGYIHNGGTGTTQTSNLTGSDPLFVSTSALNFHLQASSPAIDAGASTAPTVTTDRDGVARPQGAAYDIGAYEYHVASAGYTGFPVSL